MSNSNVKWTQELRKIVYARITMEFGPYQSWGASRTPKGQVKRFDDVLTELSDYLSTLSGKSIAPGAIHQQIAWAVTEQSGSSRNGVSYGPELPDYMLSEKETVSSE